MQYESEGSDHLSQAEQQEFAYYERPFWGVLARLARRGYVVPPGEGRDLVHDFYVDAWHGLRQRFDPALGSFETYVLGAFYRFARRRILDLQNWRSRLAEAGSLELLAAEQPEPGERLDALRQAVAIRDALARLPARERLVLGDFLGEARASERELAARHGLSRYELKSALIDALGRVASELGSLAPRDSVEGRIARSLWQEGRTARDTAALLGIPTSQVQAERRRFGAGLVGALKGDKTMKAQLAPDAGKELMHTLKRVLLDPGQEALLGELRNQRGALLAALADADVEFSAAELEKLGQHPHWVAQVYELLAAEAAAGKVSLALDAMRMDEDTEIGHAFAQALRGLPGEMQDWPRWFEGVPQADEALQSHLLERPDVRACGEAATGLVRYGLAPLSFHGATRGIELLLERQLAPRQPGTERRGPPFILSTNTREFPYPPSRERILRQLRSGPFCPEKAAEPLLNWLITAAQLMPYWFRGFRNDAPMIGEIVLSPDNKMRDAELMARWGGRAVLETTELVLDASVAVKAAAESQRYASS